MYKKIKLYYDSTFGFFSANQRKKIFILLFTFIFLSCFEIFSITLLLPLIAILIAPDMLLSNIFFKKNFPNLILNINLYENIKIYLFISILTVFIIKYFLHFFVIKLQSKTLMSLQNELQLNSFTNYLSKPYNFFLNRKTIEMSSFVNFSISDFVLFYVHGLIGIISETILILGLIFFLIILNKLIFQIDLNFFLIFLFLVFVVYIYFLILKKKQKTAGPKWTKRRYDIANYINQGFSSIREVKLFHNENFFIDKLNNIHKEGLNDSVFLHSATYFPRLFLELVFIFTVFITLIFLSYLNFSTVKIISILSAFGVAGFRIFPSINRIMVFMQYFKNYSHLKVQIAESLINTRNLKKIYENKENKKEFIFNNKIILSNICFSYNNDFAVLNNFNLEIKKGEFITLFGKSGSGKSTIADLIMGLLIPTSGKITVDGEDINFLNNNYNWQKKISYVPQNIFLINDSIKNNIIMSDFLKQTDEIKIFNIIKNFQLNDFINNLPLGLETIINEGIVNLSGGQRQRIALARAFYKDPEFIILDEPTSSLDKETAEKIMEVIKKNQNGRTILLITHEESLKKYSDKIIKI